jgi:hypothetical protein
MPIDSPLLRVRADATLETGAGHAMRCLGLIERWIHQGGKAELWGAIKIDFVRHRSERSGARIVATPRGRCDVLLVDIYEPLERVALAGTQSAAVRVCVDDFGERVPIGYDTVWNPNAYADALLYRGFEGCVLAGQGYVPVREGLPTWVGGGDAAVSLGAARLPDHLSEVLELLPAACGVSSLQCVGDCVSSMYRSVPEDDIWSELRYAPWLICAGGSTTWEAAAVGVPLVGIITADNHEVVARWVAGTGVPVIDARIPRRPAEIATALAGAVSRARPLPALSPGAGAVVQQLRKLISW